MLGFKVAGVALSLSAFTVAAVYFIVMFTAFAEVRGLLP